jgi:hypothetical protein
MSLKYFIGGGLLVDMMKRASQSKQYAEIDHAIRTKVEPFLYNRGKGKWIPISKLVLLRNKERPRHKMVTEILNICAQNIEWFFNCTCKFARFLNVSILCTLF